MKEDPSELASSYDLVQERMGEPPPGLLAHIAVRTDYGFHRD
ncbi:MAG: hypothetical protein AABM30_09750 [Actinomycetota bacterium]